MTVDTASRGTILVTGATGKTGRRIVARLRALKVPYRAVSRGSDISFDWSDETTWATAVQDVATVYLVVPDLGTAEAVDKVGRLSALLKAAGADRAVLVSTPDDGTAFSDAARATERAVVAAGLSLTSLHLRWFYQNFSEDFLHSAVMSGKLSLPAGDGREAFVDADDIAAVAVAVLTDPHHSRSAYDLTGPQLLGFADIAVELSRAIGRKIEYVPVTPDQFMADQLADGVPVEWASLLCGLYQDIAKDKLSSISGDIEAVLGQPPRTFADFASRAARVGAW